MSFGSRTFGDGFGESSFVHRLGSLLDVTAGFLHLLLHLLLLLAGFGLLIL